MKHLIFLFVLACTLTNIQAQVAQIPNNDFEEFNYDGTVRNWGNVYLFSAWIDSTGSHSDSVIFDNDYFYSPTTDAHSGKTAMLLSNAEVYGQNKVIVGSASSDEDSVFTAWGSLETVSYDLRPQSFSFYYKFLPVNNDTGMVSLTLYDEFGTPLSDVKHPIIGVQNTYQLVDIPLTYSIPTVSIASYSLNFSTFSTQDPNGLRSASFGTRLWIDDVSLNNATSIQASLTSEHLHIFPNPARHSFAIQTQETVKNISVKDINGKTMTLAYDNLQAINCSHLAKGIYIVEVATEKGVLTQKLCVE